MLSVAALFRRSFFSLAACALGTATLLPEMLAAAEPSVLPAVWYHRDTFEGVGAVDVLTPETAAPGKTISLASLATLWLIVPANQPPPWIEFAGKTYALREEGLYRFLSRPEERRTPADSGVRNLIFLHSADSTIPFLRGLSRLIAHGNRDDAQSPRSLLARCLDRPWLVLTCGPAREAAIAALRELSPAYQTRRVNTEVAPGVEKNGFDDGHSMFEVRGGAFASWALVDLDHGLLFRTTTKEFVDAATLIAALGRGAAVRYEALSPKELALDFPGHGPAEGYNFALYEQRVMRDPQARDRWYRRVLARQIVER